MTRINSLFTNNTIANLRLRGIDLSGGGMISGNTVTGVTGVDAIDGFGTSPTASITITNNTIHDNTTIGLNIGSYTVASGNTIYNETGTGQEGLQISGGEAKNKRHLQQSIAGIYGNGGGLVDNNRVFNNSFEGTSALPA